MAFRFPPESIAIRFRSEVTAKMPKRETNAVDIQEFGLFIPKFGETFH